MTLHFKLTGHFADRDALLLAIEAVVDKLRDGSASGSSILNAQDPDNNRYGFVVLDSKNFNEPGYTFKVDLPGVNVNGPMREVGSFDTYGEAIAFCQESIGTDVFGDINLITEMEDDEDDNDELLDEEDEDNEDA